MITLFEDFNNTEKQYALLKPGLGFGFDDKEKISDFDNYITQTPGEILTSGITYELYYVDMPNKFKISNNSILVMKDDILKIGTKEELIRYKKSSEFNL